MSQRRGFVLATTMHDAASAEALSPRRVATWQLEDGGTSAKVVADSVAHGGYRVTSFEIRFHRFVLSELNTHCVFARNSASSRAIPAARHLTSYWKDAAFPVSWPAEQKGMQGGAELEGYDLNRAKRLWHEVRGVTDHAVRTYLAELSEAYPDSEERKKHTLHKSLINRLFEPMQWHTALVTAATFENFFDQRCSPDAQPELRKVAAMMRELYGTSEPVKLQRGEWHTPYVPALEYDEVFAAGLDPREISTMRCARLSYLTQDGIRDWSEDKKRYDELLENGHWSPFEHVCTPDPRNNRWVDIWDPDTHELLGHRAVPELGKFIGWQSWRHVVEARTGHVSWR